ncbi:glycoside hydrolase family 172 protein [Flagellimonas onchidii]|uniref:glycoside hydrolase family 172 protein n=1 Tax=Flagellimonas onchidii TaxID=2562684 RepID=UPI0010A5B94B|nr:glycoside hydrolase family 172 protein [Allomuricauda onchidii]
MNIFRKALPALMLVIVLVRCTESQKQSSYALDDINTLYKKAPEGVETRWVSAENSSAEKGKGGTSNKGAKGDAYTLIAPNSTKVIFDQKGAGIITKIWSANSILWKPEIRRNVLINMYWDDAEKPAVSVPLAEFFGNGLGIYTTFESELFANPEGKSHNAFIPMPYRTAARIEIVNQSEEIIMFYYKINFVKVPKHDDDVLYFHAYWHRDLETELGVDFEILPKVEGSGRYLGTHVGIIEKEIYKGSWFGEGEVKVYLDGDTEFPTLVGTGTEDYIGSGWGQGRFDNRIQGALVTDIEAGLYSFYRYHTLDPVYFHKDCKITIQQLANISGAGGFLIPDLRKLQEGVDFKLAWTYVPDDGMDASKRHLDSDNPPSVHDDYPFNYSTTWYRKDDVSATAYFYLDKPSSNLPTIQSQEIRNANMERTYNYKVK